MAKKLTARSRKTGPKRKSRTTTGSKKRARRASGRKKTTHSRRKKQSLLVLSRLLKEKPAAWLSGLIGGFAVVAVAIWFAMPNGQQHHQETAQSPARESAPVAGQIATGLFSQEFQKAAGSGTADRIAYWSELLWHGTIDPTRFNHEPGAPKIRDNVPLVPDQFDCTTFVETVAAFARSSNATEFYKNLLAIRYQDPGKADFFSRNHFPEADWIPNNQRAGIIRDITGDIAAAASVQLTEAAKTIDRGKWFAERVKNGKVERSIASAMDEAWSKPVNVKVPYLNVRDYAKYIDRIPDGTIMNLVRNNSPSHPVLITHQGFVVKKDGEIYLRHATPSGNIRNLRLKDYLSVLENAGTGNWHVIGLNFNALQK